MKITFPKWYDEARKLKAMGLGNNQVSKKLGEMGIYASANRISQVTSPSWEAIRGRENVAFAAKEEERVKAKKEGREPNYKEAMAKARLDFDTQQSEETMTEHREFEVVKRDAMYNDTRSRVRISCSCKDCDNYIIFSKQGVINPNQAAVYFREKGWRVGPAPNMDRCPIHYSSNVKNGHDTVVKVTTPPPEAFVEKPSGLLQDVVYTQSPVTGRVAEVSVMSKTDKRIIISTLEGVYPEEGKGYKEGWNDSRVAADLGVNVAWVTAIREDKEYWFGPEINADQANRQKEVDEINKMFGEADEMQLSIQAKLGQLNIACRAFFDLVDAINLKHHRLLK